jgi:predicted cobalt transporter CbtA
LTWAYLRRGLAAGLLAGSLAGLFALFFAEPVLDRAVEREESSHGAQPARGEADATHHRAEPIFDRGEQKAGMILATTLYGTSVGALFGLLAAALWRAVPARSGWKRALALAGAVFAGAVLLPYAKYPPNPPGVVTDPSTLTERTVAYLALVGLSLLSMLAAWRFARAIDGISTPYRALVGVGTLVALWTFLFLAMPDFGGTAASGALPEGLIFDFRVSSLATQAVLWAGIGLFFGLLGEWAGRKGGIA